MPFTLPDDLAAAAFARLGEPAPVDVPGAARLVEALAAGLPSGSTAKMDAVARGEVPPGADPARVVEAWVERPALAWSCWGVAVLYAALVNAGGVLRAEVLGARRIDGSTQPVDIHSLVELHDGADRWAVDPFFTCAPMRSPAGEALRPGAWGVAVAKGAAWRTAVGNCAGRGILGYRTFTLPLDALDVEGFCRISTTHTGVGPRERAHLAVPDGMLAATLDRDGVARLRRWRGGREQAFGLDCETSTFEDWAEAEQALLEEAAAASGPGGSTGSDRGTQ